MSQVKEKGTRIELFQKVYEKASGDETFSQLLKNNPREAVRQLGVDVPKDVKIQVIDKEDNVVYLVRPKSQIYSLDFV